MDFFQQIMHTLIEVHPLHPMFVHFPIALTGASALFILLALIFRRAEHERVAFANLALASISTLVAGVTGYMDNVNTYEGTAPNANAKIILATVLLLLTTGTSITRWRKPDLFNGPFRFWYVAAILISFAISFVLAFLGGVILYGM